MENCSSWTLLAAYVGGSENSCRHKPLVIGNFFHVSFSILWKGKEKRKPKKKQKRKRKLWNYWENKVEAEAEAVPKIWKRKRKRFWKIKLKWKRKWKRIFFEKNFVSGSGSKFFLKKILEAEAFSKSTASKTLLETHQSRQCSPY